jgi:hypothetical protein
MNNNTKHIAELEKFYESEIPVDYKDYLLSRPEWLTGYHALEYGPGGVYPYKVDVREPWHLQKSAPTSLSLLELAQLYKTRKPDEGKIPDGAMEIASCESNEVILLFVSGSRAGQIWIKTWDLYTEGVDHPEAGMHFVAHSFTQFLSMLRLEASG